jgi:hypothetical protein
MIDILEVPMPGAVEDVTEQGLIFPVPGAEKNTVVFEPRDGDSIEALTAKLLEFKVGDRTRLRVRKVRVDLFITDARFVVACSKYDKGGGWVGGATTMVVFNTVSKARAALRSRGKMLVGQVRYPWLEWVVGVPKTGFTSEETLVLRCTAENGTPMVLKLGLPKNIASARVAAEIADRAARYRLASEEFDSETHAALTAHLDSQSRVALNGEKQIFEMAAARPVADHSARIAPSSRAEARFCGGCGEKVVSEDAFCPACGEEVAT